jgi:DNA-binding MarR family transcriptional regulator
MPNVDLSKDLDYQFFVILRQTAHVINRARDNELRKLNTSPEECAVLFIIQSIGEKATPAEIGRWMVRERNSMFTLLNRMQKKDLITMNKDLDKKNMVRVSITPKGKNIYESSIANESFHKIVASLSEERRQHLINDLRILRDRALETLNMNYKPPFP